MSEIRTIPPQLTRDQWNALLDHALEKPASYIIRNNNGTIQAINGSTGKIDYSGTDAASVINSCLEATKTSSYPPPIICKGKLDLYSPINYGNYWNDIYPDLYFDKFVVQTDNPAIVIKNLRWGGKIEGDYIFVPNSSNPHTHGIIEMTGRTDHVQVTIKKRLDGNWTDGRTTGIYIHCGQNEHFMNCKFEVSCFYACGNHVLWIELTNNAWASVNTFNLGMFEAASPQQIYIHKTGTDAFHNNVIMGCGGSQNTYNPQNLSPLYCIRLETDSTGKITGTTFKDFYVYSAYDEIYRAVGNVIGTRFIGGMPRHDLTSYWHNDGTPVDFISCFKPDSRLNTYLSNIAVPTSTDPAPIVGSMYFDTSTNKLYVYNGTSWVSVTLT